MDVLIPADSRGAGLEERIKAALRYPLMEKEINMTAHSLGGARIQNIIERNDRRYPESILFDIIYVFTGINNFTVKINNGMVVPVFDNIPDIVENLSNNFSNLKSELKARASKVVSCQTV